MNDKISRVKLYVKDTFKAHDAEIIVKNELLNNGFIIDGNNYDMVISLGGDGTFLKMLHKTNFNSNIYYASINAGSLGFLSSVEKDNIKKFISDLKNNLFNIRELDLLKIKVSSMEEIEYFSLNELTVRKTDFSSLRSDVYINNDLLENYIGDGLVVSTSIGSTGYNLALSGRSSLDFLSEANYATLKNSIKAGDYLLIGFGHNDEKYTDSDRFTYPALDAYNV